MWIFFLGTLSFFVACFDLIRPHSGGPRLSVPEPAHALAKKQAELAGGGKGAAAKGSPDSVVESFAAPSSSSSSSSVVKAAPAPGENRNSASSCSMM